MNPLDDQLREALRRRQPPPGFAARVLARAAERPSWRHRLRALFAAPRLAAAALAALLLVTAGVQYQRRREAEQAKQQLMLAMQIAGVKLNHVQQRIQSIRMDRAENTEIR